MKFSNSAWILLLVLVVLLACLCVSDARKKIKKPKGKLKSGVCKYERKGEESACNSTTNTKQITLPLKKGDSATCQATKVVSKPCHDNSLTKKKKIKGCRYERKGSEWTECDATTNERTKVLQLKTGSNPECPTTRTKTKSCGNNASNNKKKAARRARKDAKKAAAAGM